jgi:hypothetical protein
MPFHLVIFIYNAFYVNIYIPAWFMAMLSAHLPGDGVEREDPAISYTGAAEAKITSVHAEYCLL